MRTPSQVATRTGQSGQTSFEFLIATLLGMVIILGVLQLGIMFNAHSMLKLAAFNAARAAVVARADNPEDPVTLEEMKDAAKLAAFLTIIPVIPSIQGAVPKSLADIPNSVENFLSLDLTDLGERALNVLLEYLLYLDVEFVDPRARDATADDAVLEVNELVEFDDVSKANDNVIKVVVTWQFPLMMPFVNRIMIAAMEPGRYAGLLSVSVVEGGGGVGNVIDTLAGIPDLPVWALGSSLDRYFSDPINRLAGNPLQRITMRATYVMRMQWDRGPGG